MRALLCLLVLIPCAVRAHTVTLDTAMGPTPPMTSLTIDIQAGGVNLGGVLARYTTQTLTAQFAPAPFIAFWARIPSHFMSRNIQALRFGLGDIELGAEAGLWRGLSSVLKLGLAVETPSGDSADGFGNGHVAFIPTLSGGWTGGGFALNARAGYEVGLPRQGSSVPVNYVNPHSDREIFTQLTAGYAFTWSTSVFLGIDSAHPRTGPEFGQSSLRGMAGVVLAPAWFSRVAVSAGIPLAGPHRYDWKIFVSMQLRLMPDE